MIAFLRGSLFAAGEDFIWLDVNQVGYEVCMHPHQLARLPQEKSQILVYIHTMISENEVKLYGFLHRDELELFKILINISGIGGKVALGIVASFPPDKFVQTVMNQDEKLLTTIPGIGKKMAGRLVFELKDKLGAQAVQFLPEAPGEAALNYEVLEALRALGYENSEIFPAMTQLKEAGEWAGTTEDILKKILRKMSKLK
jgi:Holliday junction DNA helicase RuvA